MKPLIAITLIVAAIIFAFCAAPFLLIWSVNTLAGGQFHIDHTLINYVAVLVLLSMFGSTAKAASR